MQFHHIHLIDNTDLPTGQDWAFVEHDEQITLFIKEHALTPRALEEAWAGYRLLTTPRHPKMHLVPRQHMGSPLMNTA
jgi:hypothetical protein